MNKKSRLIIALLVVVGLFTACETKKINKIAFDLTVNEGFSNPLGFYDRSPVFSWKLPLGVQKQSAYSIVVGSSPDLLPNKADLWNSGKVKTDQSTFVNYEGNALSSRQKVYWQIKFWDNEGRASEWSERAFFELGLIDNTDWKAKWINLPDQMAIEIPEIKRKVHKVQYLRKGFELKRQIKKARLYITAKGLYQAHINGQQVGNDMLTPGWTPYQKRIETLTYDVGSLLRKGKNAMGIELAEGWHSGRLIFRQYPEESPQVLVQLEVTYTNGETIIFTTDNSWKGSSKGPILYSSLYDGESYDASNEMPAWSTFDFDEKGWEKVVEEEVSANVKLQPKRHQSVTKKVVLPTQHISEPVKGRIVFDLGQNIAGIPKLKIPVKKGQQVKVRFAEMLQANGEIYTKNYRSAVSTDFYLPAEDGIIVWHPKFTFHGFRYVELSGFDESHTPEKSWVNGLALYSDFEMAGHFSSSHDKLNQLQSNIEWGLRGNFLDIPTDCPQRDERAGWTGDAQVFIPTSFFIADCHAFWSSWMQSVQEDQREDGSIPIVVPDIDGRRVSSGWGDAATIIPWEIYLRTGDKEVLVDGYETMLGWVDYYRSVSENHIPDMHTYGDWLQPYSQNPQNERKGETNEKFINTAYYAHSLDVTLQTAKVLGKNKDVEMLQTWLDQVKSAFQMHFFNPDGSLKVGSATQTAYLMAIGFNLLEPELEKKTIPFLIAEIEKADRHLRTGFLGTPLLAPVLDKLNRIDLMFEMLFKETYPSWFYSINQGATTMWERWNSYTLEDGFNPGGMNSFNHYAYGAIGQWMYEGLAGLKPLKPGYKEILIAPIVGGPLSSAQASYNSPFGKIKSAWKVEGKNFTLNAIIPPNTTAKIIIPANSGETLILNEKPFAENQNIKLIKKEKNTFELLAQPGVYEFKTQFKS